MLIAFISAVAFTIGASFYCSMMEALILSTTTAEIESLKQRRPRKGLKLEALKMDLGDTISAILTLNTIANTAGTAVVGGLAVLMWGDAVIGIITASMTIGVLIFSEVIPKNLGVVYRKQLHPWIVRPLAILKWLMRPITYLTNLSVRLVVKEDSEADPEADEREIILLAEKGAKEGSLTSSESDMVTNALKLDDVMVSAIMTPRVVVTALEKHQTVDDVFRASSNIPFARIPVYNEELDNVVGVIRRRDLLKLKADDHDQVKISDIMDDVQFVPETVSAYTALETMLRSHHQLLAVVDEFGSLAGVITMEDIMEYIIGREIFEKDDVAIDMRELARNEHSKANDPLLSEEAVVKDDE
ncbi:MAG: hypothetical protein CBD18_06465 [Opitutales bacterium TMED158]|nr:MAG: hypothetical protein CBD18_06465 [Opitutales bacterium TMED158]